MAVFQIPLQSGAQEFPIRLNGTLRRLRFVWREAVEGGWFVDVAGSDGAAILSGLPLRPGHDLLEQHQHLGIGHLFVTVNGETDRDPTYAEMGDTVQLYYRPPA